MCKQKVTLNSSFSTKITLSINVSFLQYVCDDDEFQCLVEICKIKYIYRLFVCVNDLIINLKDNNQKVCFRVSTTILTIFIARVCVCV